MRKTFLTIRQIILVCLMLFPILVVAQDPGQNWVKQIVYKTPTVTPINNPDVSQAQTNLTYLDGLGREVQRIAHEMSGTKDLVTYLEYDAFGRQVKKYLPHPASDNTMQFEDNPTNTLAYPMYAGQNPFAEVQFEDSPIGRVKKTALPGTAARWGMGAAHNVNTDYLNTGSTYVTERTDPDGNTTKQVTNLKGEVVFKANGNLKTFYTYDWFGNLTTVCPPLAQSSSSPTVLDDLCYQYEYDFKNRLIGKKLPGKQKELIVYDALNRIIATAPAISPSDPSQVGWLITFYDSNNRPSITGWIESAVDEFQRDIFQANNLGAVENVSRTPGGAVIGYTTPVSWSGFTLLTVNYYNDYDFPDGPVIYDNQDHTVYYNDVIKPKGLATGTWVRVFDPVNPNAFELTYTLYDYKARPVYTNKRNFLGGNTKSEITYNDAGQIRYLYTSHIRSSTTPDGLRVNTTDSFEYNDQGQLLNHFHKINNGNFELMSSKIYNGLGQLARKRTGRTPNDPLQDIKFKYDIRGNLTDINDVDFLSDNLFAFRISYDKVEPYTSINYHSTPKYDGSISETYWRSASDNVLRKYSYLYDQYGRLTNGIYQKDVGTPITNSYNEEISYDDNGNITTLNRNGNTDFEEFFTETDELIYNYDPDVKDRLLSVSDALTNNPNGFSDYNTGADDYSYDFNGNLTKDLNKFITTITYNHLNLPTEILFTTPDKKITYIYNAFGQKVRKIVQFSPTAIRTIDYLDGFQYSGGKLLFFPTAEGYVQSTEIAGVNNYNYVFNYLDHLGNVRLSYGLDPQHPDTIKILEESHYYPYGLKHTNYNGDVKAYGKNGNHEEVGLKEPPNEPENSESAIFNKYKFNGMEYQDELGLNLYDMDMRDYDPAIGRWTGIDPVTHYNQSPYVGMDNNPVSIADPSGADGEPINTWHYSGSGSMYSGAGNMSSGDHMFGGSGDDFWMSNFATTGDGVAGPISMSGNTVSIYWNSLGDITTAGFDNGVRTGISSEKFESSPLFRALNRLKLNGTPNGDFNDISLLLSDSFFAGEWNNAGRPMRSKGELSISSEENTFIPGIGTASAFTNLRTGNITFYQSAFTSWTILAFNMVHEFRHRMHWANPNNFKQWDRDYPKASGLISEYYTHKYVWGLGYDRVIPPSQQVGYTQSILNDILAIYRNINIK